MELITERKLKFPSISVIHSSAGSGKTHQLVERYIDFILLGNKNTDFSNIVAITFTENASKEMRERIISRLKSLANGNDKLSKKALSISR
jgi:ATP-dependent exoDNAse (exonuclease V) beta subunit